MLILTPNEKLDVVLEAFKTIETGIATDGSIYPELYKTYPDWKSSTISLTTMTRIFNKLEKDGYIVLAGKIEGQYTLTFEGEVFIKDGGYCTRQERLVSHQNQENERNIRVDKLAYDQMASQTSMVWLTAILAIGTSVAAFYYFHELLKSDMIVWRIPYWQCVLAVHLIAIGIIVLYQLLLKKQGNKRRK